MKRHRNLILAAAVAATTLGLPAGARADEADWKRGRIYYRAVCTSCHVASPVGSISPSSRAQKEWAAYLEADKHARGKESVRHYVSVAYRDSIRSGNKAAEKFADVPEEALARDIEAFLMKGAKDGDAPANCS
jgi:hypothetical protein